MNEQDQLLSLDNLEWHSIFRDIRRYAWMIVVAMLTAAMGSYVALHLIIRPTFTSSATIVVSAKTNSDSAYSDLRMSSAMTSAFTEVLGSDLLKEKVAEDLGVLEFPGKLRVEVIPETNLLAISTTAHSPQEAFDLMQAVIRVYPTISDYVYSNAMLDVISHPTMPEEATNFIQDSIVVELSVLAALVLMTLLIALLSFLKDTVKTETAFRSKVDAKLMAVVHHEQKYASARFQLFGKRDKSSILITNPIVSFSFVETFHKICTKIEYAAVNQGCRSILVTGVTENEGKSTIASNIALSLAQKGYAVALIDADFRKPAQYKIFEKEVPPEQEVGICLLGGCRDVRRIAYYDEKTGIYMIFGTKKYNNSAELSASEAMGKMLEQCKEFVDFVILDTPPMMLVADTEGLNDLVDASVLVVRQDVPYTSDINDAADVLRQSKGVFLGCIFNDAPITSLPVTSYGHYDHYGKYGKYGYGYGKYGKYGRGSSAVSEKGVEVASALGGNSHSQHSAKRAVASNMFSQSGGYRDWDEKMRESIEAEYERLSKSRHPSKNSSSQEEPVVPKSEPPKAGSAVGAASKKDELQKGRIPSIAVPQPQRREGQKNPLLGREPSRKRESLRDELAQLDFPKDGAGLNLDNISSEHGSSSELSSAAKGSTAQKRAGAQPARASSRAGGVSSQAQGRIQPPVLSNPSVSPNRPSSQTVPPQTRRTAERTPNPSPSSIPPSSGGLRGGQDISDIEIDLSMLSSKKRERQANLENEKEG